MNMHPNREGNDRFERLLGATRSQLLNILQSAPIDPESEANEGRRIARALGLTFTQLICSLGFNPRLRDFEAPAHLLGFDGYEGLAHERNMRFTQDVYERMTSTNLISIYQAAVQDDTLLGVLQYLIPKRLRRIEREIDNSVDATVIERYRREVDAIYRYGVGGMDFVEDRLRHTDSGFRALLGEVSIIVEHRALPIGDIFFRNSVLVEEKRRLIQHGFVPRKVMEERLNSPDTPHAEREMLSNQLARMG